MKKQFANTSEAAQFAFSTGNENPDNYQYIY